MINPKAFSFAKRIIKLYRHLAHTRKEFVLSKQLLRSGTSIGANVREAQAGQSKKDFISKMSIASKKARETLYWLELMVETDYLDQNEPHVFSLMQESEKLVRLLTSIVKTSQNSLK